MKRAISKYLVYYPVLLMRRQWVPRYLRRLNLSQWYDPEQLRQIQLTKLIALLSFAKSNIPYYAKALANVDPARFRTLDDLQRVPVLTKDLLKEHFNTLQPTPLGRVLRKTTGGSTGTPVTVLRSFPASAVSYAAYWRGYSWAGIRIADPQGRFWGVPSAHTDRRLARWTDVVLNRLRCSAFGFTDKDLALYYERLCAFKPRYLYGYVSMLEAFARFLLTNNLRLPSQLASLIATAEVLTDFHRRLFEQAFRCRVYNEYGSGEVGTIAHECDRGALHISAERLIVEILRDGTPAAPGEKGDIVVTELHNTAMPLIRYNLKDVGALSGHSCSCGRGLPVLAEIAGRAYDIIYNKEGEAFYGSYFTYIFKELERQHISVLAFQVIQLDQESFVIKLVMLEKDRARAETYIEQRIRSSYGTYARVRYEYVPHIEREKSGKMRLNKSMIAHDPA